MSFVPGDIPTAEYEFFAENTIVMIVPNLTLPVLEMIHGNFGPFRPLIPERVPLWFALALKKRQRCSIQLPSWLGVDELTKTLEAERRNERFEDLPQHFFEVAHLLLELARDDFGDARTAHSVEGLLADIEDVRHAKMRAQFARVELGAHGLLGVTRLRGLTPIEINRIRTFATGSLGMLKRLRPAEDAQTQPTQTLPAGLYGQQPAFVDDRALQATLQRRR
ncbi:hypothetical protein KFE25_001293 [Diacronema lutheri]|uniref:DNA replication complex GINS protein PSF2 n=1 Tax=Diacronema lutheri TaxID=2081491 RepID=A0A8J6C9K2_DIALT|nr:hypothetical protein KFE25_001293 [Diacronema lutheri]